MLYALQRDARSPERFEYRLSEAFLEPSPGYEWTVYMININAGCNKDLMERCEPLRGYTLFINLIRKNQNAGKPLEKAVNIALDDCISHGILADYFRERRNEVFNMTTFEYTQEEALENRYLEGIAVGRLEGHSEGLLQGEYKNAVKTVKQMFIEHLPEDMIVRISGLSLAEVKQICNSLA